MIQITKVLKMNIISQKDINPKYKDDLIRDLTYIKKLSIDCDCTIKITLMTDYIRGIDVFTINKFTDIDSLINYCTELITNR